MNNRIRELRQERHMTQVRLSIELGVSQENVSGYESGKHQPSVATLLRMAQLFHVSCDYLLGVSDVRAVPLPAKGQGAFLPEDEALLLAGYRALAPEKKLRLRAYLDGLSDA